MTKTFSAATAKAQFAECLREVEQGIPVVVTRYGKPVTVMVAPEDYELLQRIKAADPMAGLAGLQGMFDDGDEMADLMGEVVAARGTESRIQIPDED